MNRPSLHGSRRFTRLRRGFGAASPPREPAPRGTGPLRFRAHLNTSRPGNCDLTLFGHVDDVNWCRFLLRVQPDTALVRGLQREAARRRRRRRGPPRAGRARRASVETAMTRLPASSDRAAATPTFKDGLGTRVRVTDAGGDPVEHLELVPELANQESSIRDRVGRLINFRHARYVRLRERRSRQDRPQAAGHRLRRARRAPPVDGPRIGRQDPADRSTSTSPCKSSATSCRRSASCTTRARSPTAASRRSAWSTPRSSGW